MLIRALEHPIFFDLLSARKSTPRLNFVRGGDFRDFRYVAFTTVTLLVPFVQSGNCFEIPFIGFRCSLPADVLWGSFVTHSFLPPHSSNLHQISHRERSGNCILYTACNELLKKKKGNHKENNVTLCYRTRHPRRDIR